MKSPRVTRLPEPVQKVVDLLSTVNFTDERAVLRANEHWGVYMQPWARDDEKEGWDALVTVVPRRAEAGRFSDLNLMVYASRGQVIWQAEEKLGASGSFWFRKLPFGDFQLQAAQVSTESEAGQPVVRRLDVVASTQETEACVDDVLVDEIGYAAASRKTRSQCRVFRFPDPRLEASVEKHNRARPRLSIYTRSPELAGCTVRFSFGEVTGSVILNASKEPGEWLDRCRLKTDFSTLEQYIPQFEISAASQ